jgi:farnesyl diphosphate synthase
MSRPDGPQPQHSNLSSWAIAFEQALQVQIKSLMPAQGQLLEAALYAVSTPGKRIRPALVQDASRLVELPMRPSQLLQFAVELIHTFSLVHDDLPCLDNDDTRRGKPTVHKQFSEAQALLAGDVLFQLGVLSIAQAAPQVEAIHFAKGLQYFMECIGGNGLIGGQSTELELADTASNMNGPQATPIPTATLLRIQDQKTTALFRASVLTPFHWMGIGESEPIFQEAQNFANAFGAAFQIADDLEDLQQDLTQQQGQKNTQTLAEGRALGLSALQQLRDCRLQSEFKAAEILVSRLDSLLASN